MIFEYSPDLPITEKLAELSEVLRKSQVVIVSGDTGSGKSTQLPKLCMQLELGRDKPIAHTQPRRLAATALASRIASECQTALGQGVGYKIRFASQVSTQTKLILMTDGILLAELEQDALLRKYNLIIIDEAHERSLNIDFLLGCLKKILPKRKDLKLIITSATLDIQRFSRFFNHAPIVSIEGRVYPVQVIYQPLLLENSREVLSLGEGVLAAVLSLSSDDHGRGRGDVLVFLPTERDIYDVEEVLNKAKLFNTEILLLFARLSNQAQQRIFQTNSTKRRIILSTNVAETSITVPNIYYVIDSGLARLKRYNPRSKVERLPIESISQASANQRKGRCGRIAPGVCVRLYSEEDFLSRPEFTEPEILRSNLASVILKMKLLKLGEIDSFQFLERPENNLIKDGFLLLEELMALDADQRLTSIGREIAQYPVDPRLGRMLVAAKSYQVLEEVLIIVSGLAVQDPRVRPMESQTRADQAHAEYKHDRSDFLSFWVLFKKLEQAKNQLSKKNFNDYLKTKFISPIRYREWLSVYQELRQSLNLKNIEQAEDKNLDFEKILENLNKKSLLIHRALLTGLLGHVGHLDLEKKYAGTRGISFQLFPGSVFGKKKTPAWIMAYELVETSKVFARIISEIPPEEIEKAAQHLVKKQIFEPYWVKAGFVGAFEKISLYGLEIIPRKKINYSAVDPKAAREFFIRGALVEQELEEKDQRLDFLMANQKLREELENFEHQQRTSGLLVTDDVCFEFFANLIPQEIADMVSFKKFYAGLDLGDQKKFFYTREFLLAYTPSETLPYPTELNCGSVKFKLAYHFEPGAIDDGVTLEIPVALLNQVNLKLTSYLVLPLLVEKCEALIRTLPKTQRLACSPPSHYAQAIFDCVLEERKKKNFPEKFLIDFMAENLSQMTGREILPKDFREIECPVHLKMNYRVRDLDQKILSESRDFGLLLKDHQEKAETAVRSVHDFVEREGLTTWDFLALPENVDTQKKGVVYIAYPALIDQEDSVKLQLLSSLELAQKETQKGLLRLFLLAIPKEIQRLKKTTVGMDQLGFLLKSLGLDKESYLEELVENIVWRAFKLEDIKNLPRTEEEFKNRLKEGLLGLGQLANQKVNLLTEILKLYQQVQSCFKKIKLEDIETQLEYLIYPGFIRHTPEIWLARYPIYLKAILYRLEKYQKDKDVLAQRELNQVWGLYLKNDTLPLTAEMHYWIEELRVSLFAQHLKTITPVSVKRILERFIDAG